MRNKFISRINIFLYEESGFRVSLALIERQRNFDVFYDEVGVMVEYGVIVSENVIGDDGRTSSLAEDCSI